MEIIQSDERMADALAPLIASFRVALNAYRGVETEPDIAAGREEFLSFLKDGYPVYAAADGGVPIGYLVCRIEAPCLWVEQLFVCKAHRRKGVASRLFDQAEALAADMGEDTVFNFVHPNNDGIIRFLRSKGYTVLNMIEVRKPYRGETPRTQIAVGEHVFDY